MACLARLDAVSSGEAHEAVARRVAAARQAFAARLTDDLNTPGALGAVFELVRDVNAAIDAQELGAGDAELVREAFRGFDRVLGVIALRRAEEAAPPVELGEIDRLIEARREARRRRDFATADGIRRELDERGILLEDTPDGTRWRRK